MAVTLNAKGTSVPYFKIGKSGTTLYQGLNDPHVSDGYAVRTNDIWFDTNVRTLKFRTSENTWQALAEADKISEMTDVDLTGLADGHFLRYNGLANTWEAHEVTGLYTDADARSAISATGSISYDSSTGVFSFTDTVLSVDGQTGAVTLNHDSLTGYVANEHIDWTADSAGTIHASNYTNTTYTIADGQLSQNNFTNALKLKLDNIEATADITDTINVTASGALMDSEVTNLAQVKAFDSSDYATAAQGTLADSAVQPNDDPTFGTVNATTVDLGNWTITESGGSLYFATGGTNKMKLDASGNLDVVGSVNSSATIT